MKKEEAQDFVEVLRQFSLSRKETVNTMDDLMRSFTADLRSTQKLWLRGQGSFLIKAGLALIAFPDPTITDIVGSALVAAGLVQLKMKRSALHMEDVYNTFSHVMKELTASKISVV